MRVLTVRQPWAWAIIHGGKDVENRTRNIAGSYRGPVAIQAGKGFSEEAFDFNALMQGQRNRDFDYGAVIGVVELTGAHDRADCWEAARTTTGPESWTCSQWAMPDQQWHLCLSDPRPIEPIPAKGRLGLWRPNMGLYEAIHARLGDTP